MAIVQPYIWAGGDPPPHIPPPRMTFEEFLEWADEDTLAEWVDGEVVFMSPASSTHQRLMKGLGRMVDAYLEASGSGELFYPPYVMRLSASAAREPDLLVVLSEHADRVREAYLDGPADVAVEIVSPSSRARDREKRFEYEAAGVREYWYIDPERRAAEFYALSDSGEYEPIAVGDGIFRSRVLEGFWLRVEWLWRETPPSLAEVMEQWRVESR